jgi:hypothetical protein
MNAPEDSADLAAKKATSGEVAFSIGVLAGK